MENWAKWADGARGGGGMLRDSTFFFSLFSPHKQEKPVSVCHNTHKHTPTHPLKDTSACTVADMYHPHHLHTHTHTHTHFPAAAIASATHRQTHPLIPPPLFFSTQSHSPLHPTTKHTWAHPPPIHTRKYNQKNYPTTTTSSPSQANPWGSTGPDWERSVMNCLVCSTESAASRQASFWRAICTYEYAWESVIQATSATYIWCQRSPVWGVKY